jgi:hypothetical protein
VRPSIFCGRACCFSMRQGSGRVRVHSGWCETRFGHLGNPICLDLFEHDLENSWMILSVLRLFCLLRTDLKLGTFHSTSTESRSKAT